MASSTLGLPAPLVPTSWLARHLDHAGLVVVDGSWYLPAMNRDPRREYETAHVAGAVFWDLDALSDQRTTLPHMLPDPATFAARVGALGIGSEHAIVAYDGSGANLSAARVWWMFRVFGHERVAVLDGGLRRWRAEGRPVASGTVSRPAGRFEAVFRSELVRSLAEVREILAAGGAQLLDARSRGRFEGTEPEPRPGLRAGHLPSARNLPYADLVAPDGTLHPPEELARRFRAAGIDLDRPVVTSCGSGVSACALALGLEVLGHGRYSVYDGSWAEWAGRADTPVETGPSR
jgi:thiosulfate/3-mercaptopyruvate sulfurtransferase